MGYQFQGSSSRDSGGSARRNPSVRSRVFHRDVQEGMEMCCSVDGSEYKGGPAAIIEPNVDNGEESKGVFVPAEKGGEALSSFSANHGVQPPCGLAGEGNGYVSAQSANGIGIGPDEGEFDADRMEFEGEGGEVAAAF